MVTALLAEPPCDAVAAFTAVQRSATLAAVHAAAFSTRKGHCPEYEQLHKDLSDFWGRQSPAISSQPHAAPSSPIGRHHPPPGANSQQQVCISPEFLLCYQPPECGVLPPLQLKCTDSASSDCSLTPPAF